MKNGVMFMNHPFLRVQHHGWIAPELGGSITVQKYFVFDLDSVKM
jgi:hypothetical protein